MDSKPVKKILAVASGGGHWSELMLLADVFEGHEVKFITTIDGLPQENNFTSYEIVMDANKNQKIAMLISTLQILKIIWQQKPDVVISTGAFIGAISITIGKILKAKTIWIESIANTQKLSASGRFAKRFSDIFIVQWPNLLTSKAKYFGQLL
jgi:UDP-N-acetylglucosamine:LPS N-acetylglucosamine transferase